MGLLSAIGKHGVRALRSGDMFGHTSAPPASLTQTYADMLKHSVHDAPSFQRVLEEVAALPRADVVAIADMFAYRAGASASKQEALERIFKVHNASENLAFKVRSQAGRSAF